MACYSVEWCAAAVGVVVEEKEKRRMISINISTLEFTNNQKFDVKHINWGARYSSNLSCAYAIIGLVTATNYLECKPMAPPATAMSNLSCPVRMGTPSFLSPLLALVPVLLPIPITVHGK